MGGFAASRWLYSEIQRRLANDNVDIKRADSHTCVLSAALLIQHLTRLWQVESCRARGSCVLLGQLHRVTNRQAHIRNGLTMVVRSFISISSPKGSPHHYVHCHRSEKARGRLLRHSQEGEFYPYHMDNTPHCYRPHPLFRVKPSNRTPSIVLLFSFLPRSGRQWSVSWFFSVTWVLGRTSSSSTKIHVSAGRTRSPAEPVDLSFAR